MKLHTPDNHELMQINRIEREGDHLIVRGVIMENMPTRAVLKPEELRAFFRLMSFSLIVNCFILLFKKSSG